MALKFRPVVVVVILFLVSKRVTGLRESCACVLAFSYRLRAVSLSACSHEYFFKGTPSFVQYKGQFLDNVVKQWLLCNEMPAVHEFSGYPLVKFVTLSSNVLEKLGSE